MDNQNLFPIKVHTVDSYFILNLNSVSQTTDGHIVFSKTIFDHRNDISVLTCYQCYVLPLKHIGIPVETYRQPPINRPIKSYRQRWKSIVTWEFPDFFWDLNFCRNFHRHFLCLIANSENETDWISKYLIIEMIKHLINLLDTYSYSRKVSSKIFL
jgi:hypothetical protein